jgi:hypothetical protein
MRAQAIWAEAWANLTSGTTRAALLAIVFILTIGGIAAVDARTILNITAQAHHFRTSGAATHVLRNTDRINARHCEALGATTAFTGTGALRTGSLLRILSMPDTQLNTWEVTPGVLAMLPTIAETLHDGSDGVWLSDDLAGTLGVTLGARLTTPTGDSRVAGIYRWADDGRARDLGFTMLIPTPAQGRFDACWATIWPQNQAAAGLLHTTRIGDDTHFDLSQLNPRLGATIDTNTTFNTRITRHASAATLLLGAAIGWTSIRLRRLEVASNLHARVRKTDLIAQHLIEAAGYFFPAAIISVAAIALMTAAENQAVTHTITSITANHILAAASGTLIAIIIAVATCREKHLFNLFKSR